MKSFRDNRKKRDYSRYDDSLSSPLRVPSMDIYQLFTQDQIALLEKNSRENHNKNNLPVVYLQMVNLGYQFLLTEWDSRMPNKAFGLSDYDTDMKIGEINLDELTKAAAANKEEILTERAFQAKYNLAVYIKVAESIGTVVTDTSEDGYKKVFEKFAVGRNIDRELLLSV